MIALLQYILLTATALLSVYRILLSYWKEFVTW